MVTRGTADRGAPAPPPSGAGSLSPDGAQRVKRERGGRVAAEAPGLVVVALLLAALVVASAVTGNAALLAALGALLLIVAVFAVMYGVGARRATARDAAEQPDAEARAAAREEPMPAAFMNAPSDVALGDTAQAHDEINPHDLPADHPGRQAAEDQAAGAGAGAGGSRGNAELNEAAPARRRPGEPGR
jgi:hypothetical protein